MPSNLRRYDVPGHVHFWTISCYRRLPFFMHEAVRAIVVEGLGMMKARFGICLIGYVVMPDHMHVIVYPHAQGADHPVPISRLLHAFKKHVGFHGKGILRNLWREHGRLWTRGLNEWAHGALGAQSIWTTRGHDFNIDRHETLLTKLDYCHKNPITRGLAERAEDWPWSSFRYYEMGDDSVLSMDWDGSWPIGW